MHRITRPFPVPVTVTVIGSKGGTGRTSTVVSLAHVLAARGYFTAVVGLDGQGTLTLRSGHARVDNPLEAPPVDVRYVLPTSATEARDEDRVAGSVILYRCGRSLLDASGFAVAAHLRRAIGVPGDPDAPHFVLIDTPPTLGTVTQEAMRVAALNVVTSDPTREGQQGLADVLELYETMHLTAPLRVLLTRTSWQTRELAVLTRQMLDAEAPFSRFASLRFPVEIPLSRAAAESAAFELPVTITAPGDRAAVAYRRLASELGRALGIRMRHRKPRAATEAGQVTP